MRIIAGERRGMVLYSPRGNTTRPITDRVKESIFSILTNTYNMPEGCKVADIFSGTGSFGLESLSRGASCVTFVDMNREVVDILKKNIEKAHYQQYCRVVRGDAFKAGAPVVPGESLFDLAFVDPPYPLTEQTGQDSRLGKMLMLMNQQMRPGGLVLVRTNKHSVVEDSYGSLNVIDRRQWGDMNEAFLRNSDGQCQTLLDGEDAANDQ